MIILKNRESRRKPKLPLNVLRKNAAEMRCSFLGLKER
nr:MAG TPA_asm: hypothetical protein [Caudoviricetes sp.]